MWIVIRAFLGGALKGVWTWLSHRSFWQIVSLILALALAVQTMRLWSEQRHAGKVEKQLSETVAAREADRAAYVKAQLDAAAKNKAQVQQVEQKQQRITSDVEAQYRADLARLRAERGKLQSPAPQRPTNGASPPASGSAASGLGCETLPLPDAELLLAQETELQLNALIDWALGQSKIDPNK